jgi:hypothetical protein
MVFFYFSVSQFLGKGFGRRYFREFQKTVGFTLYSEFTFLHKYEEIADTLVTLPHTEKLYYDSVDGTCDHITYQKLVTR